MLPFSEKLENLKDVHFSKFVFSHHSSRSSGLLQDLLRPSHLSNHFLIDLLFSIGVVYLLLVIAILVDVPDVNAISIIEDLVARLIDAAGSIITRATHRRHPAQNVTSLLERALLNGSWFLARVLLFHLEACEFRVQVVEDVLNILR